MSYADFTIRARRLQAITFQVEVIASPLGWTAEPEELTYDFAKLQLSLSKLEANRLDQGGLVAMGQRLADLLLPPPVRNLLLRSLEQVGPEGRLRLRLVLDDPDLASLPWEYLYVPVLPGEEGLDGFLALNPRTSIVRHETLPLAPGSVEATRPLRVVVGLAAPQNLPTLDLGAEREWIERALTDVPNIEVTWIEHLTTEKLERACQGAHVFHFAGHGGFHGAEHTDGTRHLDTGAETSILPGDGVLALEDDKGQAHYYPGAKLALTLRAAGVRVAVLGACQTGMRDGVNPWGGIAPALMRAGIPAALVMQYPVFDRSAVAFTRRLYEALMAGLSLDEAVVAGRLAILNLDRSPSVDWGVPVFYLRSADGVLFPELVADPALTSTREQARLLIQQRVEDLHGEMVGIRAEGAPQGESHVRQVVATVHQNSSMIGADLTGTSPPAEKSPPKDPGR